MGTRQQGRSFTAHLLVAALATLPAVTAVRAQQAAEAQPVMSGLRVLYENAKRLVLDSAEAMPEAEYGFRITPDTRTFGEHVAHVADGNYNFCSSALERPNPYPNVVQGTPGSLEKTKQGKERILEALRASFQLCDEAFKATTDTSLGQSVSFTSVTGTGMIPRVTPLNLVIFHGGWMYGNMIPYLRLKGITPAYTQRVHELQKSQKKP